jgi:hypothetical protein
MGTRFESLQKLGEEKFTKIRNELLRGTPCMTLAKTIQQEWGDLIGIGEKTLTQQLGRFKDHLIAAGVGAETIKEMIEKKEAKPILKILRKSSIDVLRRLISLANMQEMRINKVWEKEQSMGGIPLGALNVLLNDYVDLLIKIQKVQFDLGINEFKGVLNSTKIMQQKLEHPDGTVETRTVAEALEAMNDVFKKRGIPVPEQNQLGLFANGSDNKAK